MLTHLHAAWQHLLPKGTLKLAFRLDDPRQSFKTWRARFQLS